MKITKLLTVSPIKAEVHSAKRLPQISLIKKKFDFKLIFLLSIQPLIRIIVTKKIMFLLIIFSFKVSFSQLVNPPIDIKSPTASSIGKYGDVPVSHYNGTTNINIPIYKITEDGIPLEISLSYDSAGIRVNSTASWVGQNWSLNAGGVITRSIRNLVDTQLNDNRVGHAKGFEFTGHKLNTTNWSLPTNLENLLEEATTHKNWDNPYLRMDLEPDIFTFNFMGLRGKFFLGNDGEWKVQSNTHLRIEIFKRKTPDLRVNIITNGTVYQPVDTKNDIAKIIITDTNGTQYIFGNTNTEIEYVTSLRPEKSNSAYGGLGFGGGSDYRRLTRERPNSWYLSLVKNTKNQTIYEFEYERGDKIIEFYRVNSFRYSNCAKGTDYVWIASNYSYKDYYEGQIIFPVYLKKIKLKSKGEILFNSSNLNQKPISPIQYPLRILGRNNVTFDGYGIFPWLRGDNTKFSQRIEYFQPYTNSVIEDHSSNYSMQKRIEHLIDELEWRSLNSVKVSDYQGRTIKDIRFNYSPISSNLRLNLESVDQIGKNNQLLKLYAFNYDRFDELPNNLSSQFDKWGFYNGRNYIVPEISQSEIRDSNFRPPPSDYFDEHDSSRASDEDFTKIGMLTKIVYPTKGQTEFEFEAHRATKKVDNDKKLKVYNSDTPIGGVRIKKITKVSGSSTKQIINYQYEGGVLMYDHTSFIPNWLGGNSIGPAFIFDINNLFPLSNMNGSHIGYSKVIEKFQDNSSIEYMFSDYNLFPDTAYEGTLSVEQSIFNKSSDKSLLRGKLIEVKKKNASGTLKEKIILDYLNINLAPYSNKYVRAFEYNKPMMCTTSYRNSSNGYFGNAYKIFYMDYDVIKKTTEKNFGSGQKMSTSVESKYNDDFLISEIKTMNSLDQTFTRKYQYPQDFINVGNDQGLIMKKLKELNRIAEPIQTSIFKVDQKGIEKKISTERIIYKQENGLVLPSVIQTAKANNDLEDRHVYDRYDNYGNLLEYHTAGDNSPHTVLLWGYNGKLLIAKIENTTYSDVLNSLSFGTFEFDNDTLSGTAGVIRSIDESYLSQIDDLRIKNPSWMITTYRHKPLVGVTQITQPNGISTYYEYDDFNRLKTIKDKDGNTIESYEYHYKNE